MLRSIALALVLLTSVYSGFSQSYWKIRTEYGEDVLLTIEMHAADHTFKAFTRKDALKDIAGFFTYNLARAAGKLKYPEIVYIEGKTEMQKDSLKLEGVFYYIDKQYAFKAVISGSHFIGKFTDNKNKFHRLTGEKVSSNKPIKDYKTIVNNVFSIAEKNLFNPLWIKSTEWVAFKNDIDKLKPLISDDYELAASMMWLGKKFPFSPFEIQKTGTRPGGNVSKSSSRITEIKPGIGLIDGNLLPASMKEMDSLSRIISKKEITTLILDFRGRSRILPEAGVCLLNYISGRAFQAGVYLTRKWWNAHLAAPKVTEYKKWFKDISETAPPAKFSNEPGYVLAVVPVKKTFHGRIYVLTDTKTSKVFEAMAAILKSEKLATIVGQKTSGSTSLTESLIISDEFSLQIPVADFYDPNGKNFTKTGIDPDIPMLPDNAINYILKTR
jgi:pterin-4a-carbinolamine dehydratase